MTSSGRSLLRLTVWSECREPDLEGSKSAYCISAIARPHIHFYICYLIFKKHILHMLFYLIFKKTTLWSKNCYLLLIFSCFCFKQLRDLNIREGKELAQRVTHLVVILTPGCLSAKLMFFLLKNVAAIKLEVAYEGHIESSHILHSVFKLPALSLSPLSHVCVCVCVLLFLNCNQFFNSMNYLDSVTMPHPDRSFIMLSFASTSPFGRIPFCPSRLNSDVNCSTKGFSVTP